MDMVLQFFKADSASSILLILSLVIIAGLALGSIRIFGITIGIAGVLFSGLIFGHLGITIHETVLEFIREFGLILFVYTVGLQVGPGFIASLRQEGSRLNFMAGTIVLLGFVMTVLISRFAGIEMPIAAGLFSGATTNTPSLAAAQQILQDNPQFSDGLSKLPAIGYAVSYPFGIIGTILSIVFIKRIFRVRIDEEYRAHQALRQKLSPPLEVINLEITNPNLNGLMIQKAPLLAQEGIVVSRVMHNGELRIAQPDTTLFLGDILLAVGTKERLETLRMAIGKESAIDLRTIHSNIVTKKIIVTKKEILGKSIQELNLLARYGVTITRVSRVDVEFAASSDIVLQFGDSLLAVGDEDAVKKAAVELGNSPKELNRPQIVPIFFGIVLGVILGSWPIYLPGVSSPVKLGLAGGPLIVAMILSNMGRVGPLVWYMPNNVNLLLREIGIVLFLACVGLKSGDQFVDMILNGEGLRLMGYGALITLVPLVAVGIFARLKFKLNFLSLCGLLSGAMTDPPALAFANAFATSNAPSISYATVYPLVMILRIVFAQVLVLFFVS